MWDKQEWSGFQGGNWQQEIDVRSFIQKNYTPYLGDEGFLAPPTSRTQKVWEKCQALLLEELHKGVLDVDTHRISGIDAFSPGYIDKENEVIVGLQTDEPLKRMVNLYGGVRTAKAALSQYGYTLDEDISRHFSQYRKTHNEGVFDAYPKRTRMARHVGLLTGLPDAYGRGRIIGDYRRVPLYGMDLLIEERKKDLEKLDGPNDGRAYPPEGRGLGTDPDHEQNQSHGAGLWYRPLPAGKERPGSGAVFIYGLSGRSQGK